MVALKAITKASGEALEYAPYEVNLYHGCPHGCAYGSSGTCYVPGTKRVSGETFKANRDEIKKVTLGNLEQDLKNWQGERSIVHLCFLCDPYPIGWNTDKTRKCLELFRKYNHPFQVLTKGGFGACKDFDLYGPTDRFGTTLTCDNDADSLKWEPKAALPIERIESLKVAHEKGIKTWVSLEPVLDPKQTLHFRTYALGGIFLYGIVYIKTDK
jgi:DNA repair photolyase